MNRKENKARKRKVGLHKIFMQYLDFCLLGTVTGIDSFTHQHASIVRSSQQQKNVALPSRLFSSFSIGFIELVGSNSQFRYAIAFLFCYFYAVGVSV